MILLSGVLLQSVSFTFGFWPGCSGALRPRKGDSFLVLMMTPCQGVQRNLYDLIATIWVEGDKVAPLLFQWARV